MKQPKHLTALRWSPVLLAACLGAPAQAHDAWVEPADEGHIIHFGHAGQLETASQEKVRSLLVRDTQGQPLPSRLAQAQDGLRVHVAGEPALFALDYDNGYWSRDPATKASVNKPRTEVPNATSGSHAAKYGKTVLRWSQAAAKPQGLRLEIVPLAATQPGAGQALPVQVLLDGMPLAGARIMRAHAEQEGAIVADTRGRAEVPVIAGEQMLTVHHRIELIDDPRADVDNLGANLRFTGG